MDGANQRTRMASENQGPQKIGDPDAECMEYLTVHVPHLPQKWPSFVGKYSSTMVRIWWLRLPITLNFSISYQNNNLEGGKAILRHLF